MSKIIQNEVDSIVHTTRYVRGQLIVLQESYLRLCSEQGITPKGDLVATLGDVLDLTSVVAAKTGEAEVGHGAVALLASEQVVRTAEVVASARETLKSLRLSVRGSCGLAASHALFGQGNVPKKVSSLLGYVDRARTALDDTTLAWKPTPGTTVDKAHLVAALDALRISLAEARDAGSSRKHRARETQLVRNQHAEVLHRASVAVRALAEALFVLVGDGERAAVLRHRHVKRAKGEVTPTPTPPVPVLPPAPPTA